MFNLPEISETFSQVIWAERIRETDQLPVAYGKTFEEFYGLPPREEILEEAPAPTPSEQPATECSDGCLKAWGGDCIAHKPLVETVVAVSTPCTEECRVGDGWTYHEHAPRQTEEVEVPDVCGDDCEYRWGSNCAAHWVDENSPRRIERFGELRVILSKLPRESWEVIRHGTIPGEEYDLMATNRCAIRIDRGVMFGQKEGWRKNFEYLIITEEVMYQAFRMHCMKHGVFQKRLFAECTCLA